MISFTPKEKNILSLIGQCADELGIDSYVIGGYVRDKLIGRACKDIDIVCIGSGIELARQVSKKHDAKPKVAVFQNFGTAQIKIEDFEIEFVGARKESYRKESRNPIVEDGTLEDDQNRRDFTINALGYGLNGKHAGTVLDPFDGIADLKAGIIKTPLDPDITYSDDPLRMMRAIRFATQLQFVIDDKSLDSIAKNKDRIAIISQERITDELIKIMKSDKPSIGFTLLFDTGLLPIIMPTIYALHGIETRNGIAHKDNFYHTIQVLDNVAELSDNIWLRWSALYHDVGKPRSKKFDEKIGWTFHGHDVIGARMVKKIFKRLKLPLDNRLQYVQKMVRLHLRPISLTKHNITDSAVRRMLFEAGDDVDDLMVLCRADITSKNEFKVKKYQNNYDLLTRKIIELEEKDRLRNWQPPIDGEEIMKTFNLTPSRMVGDIKLSIREAILNGDIPNEYEAAKSFMMAEGQKLGLVPNT